MINIDEYAIVSDFDGTVILQDTNDVLFTRVAGDENRLIEDRYRAGEADARTTMERHFEAFRITLDEYYAFLDENISVDPGFLPFLLMVREKNLPFFLVSGGFRRAIRRMLGDGLIPDTDIYANDLVMTDRLRPVFASSAPVCNEKTGPCGNCKKECIEDIRKRTGKKILYIGDGMTDRCAVKKADFIYAKDSLAEYCRENKLVFKEFCGFADIMELIVSEQPFRLRGS